VGDLGGEIAEEEEDIEDAWGDEEDELDLHLVEGEPEDDAYHKKVEIIKNTLKLNEDLEKEAAAEDKKHMDHHVAASGAGSSTDGLPIVPGHPN
jgi:hypothetical protein